MIFIVNKGYPRHLSYVAEQIEMTNGKGSLVLVLDEAYPEARRFKTLVMRDYSDMAGEFAKLYKPFFLEGDTHHEFDLIWFQRYMFVLEYLESIGHKGDFWIVDSDVMVYSDLGKAKILEGKRFTRNKVQDPCFTWFADSAILREFCEYMLDYYRNRLPEIEAYFIEHYLPGKMGAGICEMTFLRLFADERLPICQDLSVPVDGWAFDRGIHEPDGYRQNSFIGGKKIYWDGRTPYGILKGERVNFHGLHCQGLYKNLIPLYFSGAADPEDIRRGKAWKRSFGILKAPKVLVRKVIGYGIEER